MEVTTDGRPVGRARSRAREIEVRFEHDQVLLAQIPGANFYHRLREKFGASAPSLGP